VFLSSKEEEVVEAHRVKLIRYGERELVVGFVLL
jgi:hypothetical protein